MYAQDSAIRAVYAREKPRLTLAAAYIIRERNYLYEYKLQGQDKPRLEQAVNVDFVPFIRGVSVLCKPRLIFSRINGPIVLFCDQFSFGMNVTSPFIPQFIILRTKWRE